ncbi:MAG: molybdopterin-dependent oxidoreductase [Treponema sp.]|jgi:CO/xanthine dehydrogenase Mo-binding subunit|nr:molybdopterin-dependent oxidoreductase [Treponema sp.]
MIQVPRMPEDYTFITAKNIPGVNKFYKTKMPILADTQLSYIGEPVALITGPDKIKLEYFAAKCIVIVDEEQPVFNPKKSYSELKREHNIGNVEKAFERDDLIITSSYSTGIQDHWYAEPAGAITWFSDTKNNKISKKRKSGTASLTVKTSTQWPYHVKRAIAGVLSMDEENINVEQTALFLHMDGKLWYPSFIACHAALCTFITKQPVRLILNRKEDFFFSPKRCGSSIDIASVVDKNGKITAAKVDISVNLGAFEVNGNEILDQICIGSSGFYKIDNLKLTARAFCTNLPPQGPFSGFGLSQGAFAVERHVSLIADTLSLDPALWRQENATPTDILPGGFTDILFDNAAKMSDYYRKWSAYELLRQTHKGSLPDAGEMPRGIGMSIGFQGNGLLYNETHTHTVEVTLTKESKLEIKTSIASTEDYSKIWEKIALQNISIEPGMVKIITDNSPDCGPSCSSRNITLITKLVEKCCAAIRKQRFRSPLPITVRRSSKPANKGIDYSCFSKPGCACAVVEVSIDLVECIPKVRGVWLSVDGGKIVSKNRARRSLIRGAVQALGWAFTEYIEYINGALPKNQYDNFSIPSSVEIPPIHIEFLKKEKSDPKGIGELPFTCIPSAFLQAVSQAMDHAFKNIPLKRHDIWNMVQLRGKNDN